jgi:hypothetical protein
LPCACPKTHDKVSFAYFLFCTYKNHQKS